MAEITRFCVVCAHCDQSAKDAAYYRCLAPQSFREFTDLVTGERRHMQMWAHCTTHRARDNDPNCCGPSGEWFQPIETAQAAE